MCRTPKAQLMPYLAQQFPHFTIEKPELTEKTLGPFHKSFYKKGHPYETRGGVPDLTQLTRLHSEVRSWTMCSMFPESKPPVPEPLCISTLNCWLVWGNLFFSPALERDPRSLVGDLGQMAFFLSSSTRPFEPMGREWRDGTDLNN